VGFGFVQNLINILIFNKYKDIAYYNGLYEGSVGFYYSAVNTISDLCIKHEKWTEENQLSH